MFYGFIFSSQLSQIKNIKSHRLKHKRKITEGLRREEWEHLVTQMDGCIIRMVNRYIIRIPTQEKGKKGIEEIF